jgi:hypothetical protein
MLDVAVDTEGRFTELVITLSVMLVFPEEKELPDSTLSASPRV